MIRRQVMRWVTVGVFTNASLYLCYLALAQSLLAPTAAMTVVYVAGVLIGFIGHRVWSFEHKGRVDAALVRYVAVYALGYVVNYVGLEFGLAILHWRHEVVQGAMIAILAVILFVLQRYFVFPDRRDDVGASV